MKLAKVVWLLALLLAACGGGGGTSTSGPTVSATPPPRPRPSCAPATANGMVADSLRFDRTCIAAPAGTPSTIDFANDDAGESHDVAIYPASSCLARAVTANKEPRCQDPTGPAVFRGPVIVGVDRIRYDVPALARGDYVFLCEVHPFMHGVFRVR